MRFLGFFEYLSYFLFLYYLYILRSFFNFFQIMDFLNIFSCFEALSSTFGWFSHVFWIFSAKILYILVLLCFGKIAIFIRWLHIERKEGPLWFSIWGICWILRRLVFSLLTGVLTFGYYYTNTKTHIRYLGWAMLRWTYTWYSQTPHIVDENLDKFLARVILW